MEIIYKLKQNYWGFEYGIFNNMSLCDTICTLFVNSTIIISIIHPSTKSPLAGAAWNFSQSQARQLCNAGLSVATADKRRET